MYGTWFDPGSMSDPEEEEERPEVTVWHPGGWFVIDWLEAEYQDLVLYNEYLDQLNNDGWYDATGFTIGGEHDIRLR